MLSELSKLLEFSFFTFQFQYLLNFNIYVKMYKEQIVVSLLFYKLYF